MESSFLTRDETAPVHNPIGYRFTSDPVGKFHFLGVLTDERGKFDLFVTCPKNGQWTPYIVSTRAPGPGKWNRYEMKRVESIKHDSAYRQLSFGAKYVAEHWWTILNHVPQWDWSNI